MMDIMVVGKRIRGRHLIMTSRMLSAEQLDGMNKKGWVLFHVKQQQDNFEYDFIKINRYQANLAGWS